MDNTLALIEISPIIYNTIIDILLSYNYTGILADIGPNIL